LFVKLVSSSLPDVGFEPDQLPDAVHDVVSTLDHSRVVVPFWLTVVGMALRVTEGEPLPPPDELVISPLPSPPHAARTNKNPETRNNIFVHQRGEEIARLDMKKTLPNKDFFRK
jgi:hypothetical protein